MARRRSERTQEEIVGTEPIRPSDLHGIMAGDPEPDPVRDGTPIQTAGGFGREVKILFSVGGSSRVPEGKTHAFPSGPETKRLPLGGGPPGPGSRTDHEKAHTRGDGPGKACGDAIRIRMVEPGSETTPGSGRQSIHQGLIRGQPGPSPQLIGPRPRERLAVPGLGGSGKDMRGIKSDRYPPVGRRSGLPAKAPALTDLDPEFLPGLPHEGLLGPFTGLHLAPGKFPEPCPGAAGRTFLDQESSLIIRETKGDDCGGLRRGGRVGAPRLPR